MCLRAWRPWSACLQTCCSPPLTSLCPRQQGWQVRCCVAFLGYKARPESDPQQLGWDLQWHSGLA